MLWSERIKAYSLERGEKREGGEGNGRGEEG